MAVVSEPAYAGWVRKDAETIRLDGDVDENSYNEYLEVSKAPFSVVELDSGGGFPLIALKIAEDISQKNAKVIIKKDCFSACANYLALSGRELIVPCDALLGWHGSPSLENNDEIKYRFMKEDAPDGLEQAYVKWLDNFRARENNFFKLKNINSDFLAKSVQIPEKYKKFSTSSSSFTFDEDTGQYSVSRSSVASIWLPSKNSIGKYGIKTSGFCKNYDETHIENLIKERGYKFNFSTNAN